MRRKRLKKLIRSIDKRYLFYSFLTAVAFISVVKEGHNLYLEYQIKKKAQFVTEVKSEVKKIISENFHSDLPRVYKKDKEYFRIDYSFDQKLEEFVKKQLKRYRPDYASVVVIDNRTGKILSAIDYSRENRKTSRTISFAATHPAASIFKIITAADLIENHNMDTSKKFSINGRGTTLYKYQLKDKVTRWTRSIPFSSAFAYSNNPVFGKAALKESSSESLYQMGVKLGFNRDIMDDFDLGKSLLKFPEGDYELAEISSGFNRHTLISPVHGAVLASVIANNGVLKKPHLVEGLTSQNFNISFEDQGIRVLTGDSSDEVSLLMQRTTKRGTARGAFRRLNRKLKNELEIGGKTGSITGGVPFGKRDWFVAYAKPKVDSSKYQGDGISLCVMMINKKKWYVKSSYLARRVIEYYYQNQEVVN